MFDPISFLTYATVTAATPGPNNIMSMSNGVKWGIRKSLPFNLGIWAGMSIIILICTLLGNTLHVFLPMIEKPMQFIGAAYMLYLGWQIYSSSDIGKYSAPCTFTTGMVLQFINIKYYIYCLVSLEVYILPHYHGQWLPLILFSLLLAGIGFAFTMVWAFGGTLLKTLFTQYAKIVNTVLALSMVYCAISLFI